MANLQLVAILHEGVEKWNQWRRDNPSLGCPDLSEANLASAQLGSASLQEVSLCNADLTAADLRGANLVNADLRGADFSNADLRGANFTGSDLRGANLRDADLRFAFGLALSGNNIKGAQFSPRAGDPWSVLRRNYTGSKLLFHLLLLLAFFIPYTVQAIGWVAINHAQLLIRQAAQTMRDSAWAVAERPDEAKTPAPRRDPVPALAARQEAERRVREIVSQGLEQLSHVTPCLAEECTVTPVWKTLIGFNRGPLFALLALSLLLYNTFRLALTWTVGALRDEEERSGYAPVLKGWTGYLWLFRLHRWALGLLAINAASLFWHAIDWLSRPVWLPSF